MDVLQDMPPWQGSGNMLIADVTLELVRSISRPPAGSRPGTRNIADAVGLGATIDYVERLGIENIAAYEHFLLEYATAGWRPFPDCIWWGPRPRKPRVASFVLDGYEPLEVGKALNARRESPCAPGIIAPSRSCGDSAWRQQCDPPSPSTTPARKSTA